MIWLCLLALQTAGAPKFVELADPTLTEVRATAIVKLPPLSLHERSLLHRLLAILPSGPPEYSQSDIFGITGGRILKVDVMPDHLSIEVPAYKEDLAGAVSVLAETLRNARVDTPDAAFNRTEEYAWTSLVHGPFTMLDKEKLEPHELQDFYHRLVRPDCVSVSVSGPFETGAARALWLNKTKDWQVDKFAIPWPMADPLPAGDPKLGGFELDAPEISPDAPIFNATLLALFALGSGKGASLFRVAREQDSLSYRQESVLWPTYTGWQPRLIVAASELPDPEKAGERLRADLLKDVDAWGEPERQRALGMSDSVLLRGGPFSPLYFYSDRPVSGSPSDQAFLQAYWAMKTGAPLNVSDLTGHLHEISLDSLKATARDLLTHSHVIGRRRAGTGLS